MPRTDLPRGADLLGMSHQHLVHGKHGAYTANALANAFVDATGDHREDVVAIVEAASRQLIRGEVMLDWRYFDPYWFFAQVAELPASERIGMALRLLGFVHWLWLVDLLETRAATSISLGLTAAAPPAKLLADLRDKLERERVKAVGACLPN